MFSRSMFTRCSRALTHAVLFFFHALAMILMCALKQKQKSDANKCKMESKSYLECRMAKELMASQPLAELGFTKEDQKEETNENRGRKEEENKRSTKEEENERNGFVAGARRARQQQKEFTEAAYRRRREGRE